MTFERHYRKLHPEYQNMAKAHVVTKDGSKITVEGSPEEVAVLIARLKGHGESTRPSSGKTTPQRKSASKINLSDLIAELIDGGFFKKPKELAAVKVALEEQGHFYPVTSLSPALLRLVRKKQLRRLKSNKRWLYVG